LQGSGGSACALPALPRVSAVAAAASEKLWQPRDVDGDPSRLIIREHFCLPGFALVVPGVDVGERLWNFACKTV
jgi:hypothetical protein